MRCARFLLAAGIALVLSGCVHEQYAQQGSARTSAPSPSARHLYSTSPAYAQQAYEQVTYEAPVVRPMPVSNRGFFTLRRNAPPPAEPVYVAPPPPAPMAVGGPYVAAPDVYASVPIVVPAAVEQAYTLDAGDKLRVVVFGQDGITNSYTVDASGKVNMPLIGAVAARGLTNQQLAAAITAKLKQGFVREPHVTVEVETYRPFFILGEVTTPGQYPFVANMTAEMAVAIAGGFAPRAFKKTVELTRRAGGQQIHTEVPLDFPVRPGDTIVVKERWF
ncbi:MAG TPA: polysaccharide biosynthesis/export family protein [Pseudolabrys sp.]|nr:polysaccharide biosynthesis/export family protein [Pseudolabrys sp.]